jgi:predicted O-linked N-acetylglucosamine transferase (SPINDLY family)/SAM-dependent methyltransferase
MIKKQRPPFAKAAPSATEGRALDHLRAGRFDEAASLYRQIVGSDPQHWRGLHLLGLIAYRQKQFEEAAQLIGQSLAIKPDLAEAHSDLGVALKELGRLEEARQACETAIGLKPEFHPAYSNLGNILKAQGRLEEAALHYRRALDRAPDFVDALINLGNTLILLGEAEEALLCARKAARLAPASPDGQVLLAHALRRTGDIDEAIKTYFRAIELRPDFGPIYSDLGTLLNEEGHHDEAVQAHQRALQLAPGYAEGYNNLGIALRSLGRFEEAVRNYRRAVQLKPDYAEAYSNLGAALDLTGRPREAVEAYRHAIEINPRLTAAYVNLAGSLGEQGQVADAISAYRYALSIDPDQPNALVDLYHFRRHACDWGEGMDALTQRILSDTYAQGKRVAPFPMLNLTGDPAEEQRCARIWAKGLAPRSEAAFAHEPPPSPGSRRLRIGYLSADFCRHATANLIAELIERHDRSRVEVFGYSYGADDDSAMRRRLVAGFDCFADIGELPHFEAARRIHADRIDILVDLKGYTTHARTEILAHRPAPIQVNYLGYPGTMGAPFIDYIIADAFILPPELQPFFDEKAIWLPQCYQPNDTRRAIAQKAPSRAECGLPDSGFVFCSFNNNYKISPEMFGIWIGLLAAAPGSVLWLLEGNAVMRGNLSREAQSRGIDPARLVFSPKLDLPQHLARHAHADLFLDTVPVNAHTTASDALWAGLPVLTCAGRSFASRVAGSLLRAVGLPELVTHSLADYEVLALRLARHPAELANLRDRLARNRETAPLFDITSYARDLETAFGQMAAIAAAGEPPRAFAVAEIGAQTAPQPARRPLPSPRDGGAAEPEEVLLLTEPVLAGEARIPYEACPLCRSPDFAPMREADCSQHPIYHPILPPTMAWRRCGACGHVFTEGYFTPEAAGIVFAKTVPHQTVGHDIEQQRLVSARMVERVARHVASGDWLDVGFGNGSLLFTAEEWGYRPVGLDLRAENVRALGRLGYEAYQSTVEELDFPNRFSVISMADVLEHVPYPGVALKAARRLLRKSGVLFVSMPNMASMIWRAMDASNANPYWGEIEHYHNFSRSRLYHLLEEHGFTPADYAISERYRACMEVIAKKR